MMKLILSCAVLAALVSSAGSVAAQQANSPQPPNGGLYGNSLVYRIGPEDVLQISVWKNEPLSRTVPVRPDGMISLPLLNDVKAAGLTPMELRDVLAKKLVEFIPSPEVSVIVTEVKSFMVTVIGQVMKPGRYDLRSSPTVVDALAIAGGFKEFASRSRISVLRTEGNTKRRIPFDYDVMKTALAAQANFPLVPGDIVMVP